MRKKKDLEYVELFAGCGGMSLGLEASGFNLFFANELSPMASETYAYNIFKENLQEKSANKKSSKNVIWLNSEFKKNDLENRLRENPFSAKNGRHSDITKRTNLSEKLLVGDVNSVLEFFQKNPDKCEEIKQRNIDLLSGGPPCQGFSLAGKRIKDDYKNALPLTFASLTAELQPKVVLLENVKGIISPFKDKDGKRHHAWLEVSKAFALNNYFPVCIMLNAKYYGAPQNRPRFILFAYRKDIFNKIEALYPDNKILKISREFQAKVNCNKDSLDAVTIKDFRYFNIEEEKDQKYFDDELLPKITHTEGGFISAGQAIEDIRRTDCAFFVPNSISPYAKKLLEYFPENGGQIPFKLQNHEKRNHSYEVKTRFRFYQIINDFQNGLKKSAFDKLSGKTLEKEQENKLMEEFMNYNFFFKNGVEFYRKPKSKKEITNLIDKMATKKHSQRAIKAFEPVPAQLTIPDDLCHYHMENLRTFTVREMARFQSFPDWFEFKSKVTTGGKMRRFEVPQYTQVGNAVPPLLARALGKTIKKLLEKIA